MCKKFVLFFLLICSVCFSFSQKVSVNAFIENKIANKGNDTIYYDIHRPLKWEDFKGTPDYHFFGGAVTASGFAFDAAISMVNDLMTLKIGIYTFFSKNGSWKKPDINSDYHLLHEQNHFNITRIGASQFLKKISEAKFTRSNYQQVMTSIFDSVYKENMALQKQYDNATEHSINQQQQLLWNDKIGAELNKVITH
ncbi:MAG: DUF922 domain-containing protein [Chitinophagaceae bacterium]|nr:DUF922 domain-containing protein [Chitinophagaceae bacterium]